MSEAAVDWLFWPEAMTWLLSRDRAVTSEIGEWFRGRMADNRSAERVHEIWLADIALRYLKLPYIEDERALAAAAALQATEGDLLRMLERGTCVARGKRTGAASPELIPAWDWADSIVSASRTFELRGALDRKVKFYDVRIDALGLPDWSNDDQGVAPSATPSTAPAMPSRKRGRTSGSGGYTKTDEPLLAEMRQLIDDGTATSPHNAAGIVAPKAKGATLESRQRRLADRFRQMENNGGK